MPEPIQTPDHPTNPPLTIQFGEERFIEEAGFSFHPIEGFELEVDGSVYMYSEDGNVEVSMVGGELDNETTIAELNDQLAGDFMENFDEFSLIQAGKDTIQGITGFLNQIRFNNAEEEGIGRALICSPHINQFFFLLVISSAEHWDQIGDKVFTALKQQVHFHPQFRPAATITQIEEHPDLTIEIYEAVTPDEDLVVTLERGDISLLMAVRTELITDDVSITQIHAPDGQLLYQYNPITGEFDSAIITHPLTSKNGELCFYMPASDHQSLEIGGYQFSFATKSGMPLLETQVIIRQAQGLDLQKLDLNIWLALENERFNHQDTRKNFETSLRESLTEQLAPLKIIPGSLDCFHPAPDELTAFACVNLDTDLVDCSYMILKSVENSRALNIALVDRITQGYPPVDAPVNAVCSGSPGMILSPASPHACIIVNYSSFEDDFSALAKTIIEQLVVFSGVKQDFFIPQAHDADPALPLGLSQEAFERLRSHPLFYLDS